MIEIRGLKLRCLIGTEEWERRKAQEIFLTIAVLFDAARAGESDDLNDTVDYKALQGKVIRLVEASRFFLLEKLGAEILRLALEDPRVLEARVTIEKPRALKFVRTVAVTLSRKRGE
ncbi:MAG: FolB domain-containing protein [Elusimicrobia bacterium]|nr:FolB domain-containing protein [Elusimicrobiota bacterium]